MPCCDPHREQGVPRTFLGAGRVVVGLLLTGASILNCNQHLAVQAFPGPVFCSWSLARDYFSNEEENLNEWDCSFKLSNHYLLYSSPLSLLPFSCITELVSWERKCFRAFVTNLAASTCSNLGFLGSVCAICREKEILASSSRRERTQICRSSDSVSLIYWDLHLCSLFVLVRGLTVFPRVPNCLSRTNQSPGYMKGWNAVKIEPVTSPRGVMTLPITPPFRELAYCYFKDLLTSKINHV